MLRMSESSLAVDGPQRVVSKEGLKKRLSDKGVDPLDDALGDDGLGHNSSLFLIDRLVGSLGLRKVVGGG